MEKYRGLIYRDYASNLEDLRMRKSDGKEAATIRKYIKRNYMHAFPKDKNADILDVGCGQGHYIQGIMSFGYKNVKGIDTSESNIDYCKNKGYYAELADAIEYFNLSDELYDVIVFNDIIEHFTKNEIMDILGTMKNHLKNGGVLIIKTLNVANPFTGLTGRYMDFTHEIGFTEHSLKMVCKAVGYKDVKVRGADIYVFGLPAYIIKGISKIVYGTYWLFCCMAGRWSNKIFEKNIICFARRRE